MKTVVIVTPFADITLIQKYHDFPSIAVESGFLKLISLGIKPIKVIGDFDSSSLESIKNKTDDQNLIVLPTHKDFSDTEEAIILAKKMGYDNIILLASLGGRYDHAHSLLLCLKKYYSLSITLEDLNNRIHYLKKGSFKIEKEPYPYFGIFGFPKAVITLKGVAYPLTRKKIKFDETLVISNEVNSENALVKVIRGQVLLIESKDQ